jgi:hypothetical protein
LLLTSNHSEHCWLLCITPIRFAIHSCPTNSIHTVCTSSMDKNRTDSWHIARLKLNYRNEFQLSGSFACKLHGASNLKIFERTISPSRIFDWRIFERSRNGRHSSSSSSSSPDSSSSSSVSYLSYSGSSRASRRMISSTI